MNHSAPSLLAKLWFIFQQFRREKLLEAITLSRTSQHAHVLWSSRTGHTVTHVPTRTRFLETTRRKKWRWSQKGAQGLNLLGAKCWELLSVKHYLESSRSSHDDLDRPTMLLSVGVDHLPPPNSVIVASSAVCQRTRESPTVGV